MEKGYKTLNVYKKADQLVKKIYIFTKYFPKEEMFGLVSQMRRSAVSVVANLVEGWARKNSKEKTQFYYISRGSLTELEYYIDLSFSLQYLNKTQFQELFGLRNDVGKLLNGLIKSQE